MLRRSSRLSAFAARGFGAVFATALLLLGGGSAHALAIYRYEGTSFDEIEDSTPPAGTYTTSMRVTLEITLASPLPPDLAFGEITSEVLSFSATDGRNRTLTEADSDPDSFFRLATNSNGEIVSWNIQVLSNPRPGRPGEPPFDFSIDTMNDSFFRDQAITTACGVCLGWYEDTARSRVMEPGTWTLIPEPSTAVLFAAGLAALGLLPRRR